MEVPRIDDIETDKQNNLLIAYINTAAPTTYTSVLSSTTGFKIRSLHSVVGDGGVVTLNGGNMEFEPGKYDLEMPAGGRTGTNGTSLQLYDETLTSLIEQFDGLSLSHNSGAYYDSITTVYATLTITATKVVSIKTKSDTGVGWELLSRVKVIKRA